MKALTEAFEQLQIPWEKDTADKFVGYMDGILEWNEKINLTAIKDRDEFVVKHLVDSILCAGFPEYKNSESIIDVGTGAGFPGIPLAIISPDKDFVLADSLNKRLKVINDLTDRLGIYNVETVHGRAEELARNKNFRENFDLCVSRAVANMAVLAEYCLPFIRMGGHLLAYKGPDVNEELKSAEKAIKTLGGKVLRIETTPLQGYEHNIVVIEKMKKTPAKYPRKAGTPVKEPIL
ncbi:MAG: 16S rRNA (guanine(527)-N(7))-methyltransferase RsmG [Emergencia sp.]|nr:16S rRNA (guanine(527)-N(7))-methyltransferase RsmG [Emergencia sp.]